MCAISSCHLQFCSKHRASVHKEGFTKQDFRVTMDNLSPNTKWYLTHCKGLFTRLYVCNFISYDKYPNNKTICKCFFVCCTNLMNLLHFRRRSKIIDSKYNICLKIVISFDECIQSPQHWAEELFSSMIGASSNTYTSNTSNRDYFWDLTCTLFFWKSSQPWPKFYSKI